MASRKPPDTTMGSATRQNVTPAEEATQADPPKTEPKKDEPKGASKALKKAAEALSEVLNSAGVLDYNEMYGEEFAAFHKAAKSSDGDYTGLDVGIMNEDVSDSVAYHKRIKSRRYWGAKLAAL